MANILQQIVADKRLELISQKRQQPLASFIDQLRPSSKDFYAALSREHNKGNASFILECKKASPSKGLIRADFDILAIAKVYQKYAAAISVLTDKKYFQGDHQLLKRVTASVTCPVLNKDFFIDPYQVYLARHCGADAILLMLSVLDDTQYIELAELANSLNLAILTEVSNEQERDRAIALGAKLIGINNRNLRDLTTDLRQTLNLAPGIPADRIVLSESGIYHNNQVRQLAPFVDGFLVGSSLMAEPDLDLACRKLIFGQHKICGLTQIEHASAARDAGACFGGLIFVGKSPRYLDAQQAQAIVNAVPELNYVGVFVNHELEQVLALVNNLRLSAVQLHGQETEQYLAQLRERLPASCQIWRALAVQQQLPKLTGCADHWLLDGKAAGSGQAFNWQLLPESTQDLSRCLLAGGLSADNITAALKLTQQQNLFGLDINSGVEQALGVKSAEKIHALFDQIRQY
jgi:indole-3-glycerol phosphate synthase / phosphoribosylanthranilate isomerase